MSQQVGLVALVNFLRLYGDSDPADASVFFGATLTETLFTPWRIIQTTISGFLCYAALTLYRLERRGVALLGGTMALLTFPWTLIGLPIGIWVLSVLHSPAIKEAFPDYRPRIKSTHDGNPWPHRIFWLIITIVVVPIVLLVISLSATWFSYRAAEAPAPSNVNQIEAQSSAGGELKADVEGGNLSLLGISNLQDEIPIWVRPDETPFNEIKIDSSDINVTPESGENAFQFLFKTVSLPTTTTVMTWNATPRFSTLAQGTPRKNGLHDPSLILLAGTWPNHIREVDLKALIATGEFTTLASCKAEAVSNDSYSHQAGSAEGKEWEITFSCPHHDNESTVVILAHNYEGGEIRLVAQSSDGSVHSATKEQTGAQHLTAVFEGLDIIDIEQFMAQIRPFKTINFSSVKLPIQ